MEKNRASEFYDIYNDRKGIMLTKINKKNQFKFNAIFLKLLVQSKLYMVIKNLGH